MFGLDLGNNNITQETSSATGKRILLVLDWSNLMFRSFYMHRLFGTHGSNYSRPEDLKSFINKFTVDICSIVNIFHPGDVIIAVDGQNVWRKGVDETLPYKGNREKDPTIDWDDIYRVSNDLLNILRKRGMKIAKSEHAEADDIIALVKETVFESYNDCNMIIVSADADIRQLIEFNESTHQYCIVYNTTGRGKDSKRRLYVTDTFKKWIDEEEKVDIFFSGYDASKHYIKDILMKNSFIEPFVENPDSVVLNKILCGDDGDNVASFYGFYNGGRYVRVTPSKAQKILEQSGARNVKEFVNAVPRLKEIFERVCKHTINDIDFGERLHRQRTLVELNSELFPDEIKEYKETVNYMIRNSQTRNFQNLHAQEILKGSDYEGYDKKRALDADVFRDIEKLVKARNNASGNTDAGTFSISTELSLEESIRKNSAFQQQKTASSTSEKAPDKEKNENIFGANPLF